MDSVNNPFVLLGGLSILALAPFLVMMMTSFLKFVVVLYILRSAIGLQQAPPAIAINGLAIILTMYVMAPVGIAVFDKFNSYNVQIDDFQNPKVFIALGESIEPLKDFLFKHSTKNERYFFVQTTKKLWPPEMSKGVTEKDLLILVPSFLMSELKTAFQIGFLVYLPFIVIDLVISSILLSMGMIMMSPVMISMPFKILLFVMADGWTRLIHSLVMSYQ
jgi:type III secretion protein R